MTPQRRAAPWIGVVAWAFVGGAALHLALWLAINWYRVFGPYLILRLDDVSSILIGMAPFLLAAAVLVGAGRWPTGRRWLIAGAMLSAVHGVARSVNAAWWAWWQMSDPIAPEGLLQGGLITVSLVEVAAGALVPVCLAVGLTRGRRTGTMPRAALISASVAGAAVVAGGFGMLVRELAASGEIGEGSVGYAVLGLTHRLLALVGGVGFAALALGALAGMPSPWSRRIAELLIGTGALLAAAGAGASWIGQAYVSLDAQSTHLVWVFTVPLTVMVIGMILVTAGFGIAALQPGRGPLPHDREHPAPFPRPWHDGPDGDRRSGAPGRGADP